MVTPPAPATATEFPTALAELAIKKAILALCEWQKRNPDPNTRFDLHYQAIQTGIAALTAIRIHERTETGNNPTPLEITVPASKPIPATAQPLTR